MTTQWSVSQRPLPAIDDVPVPDIVNRLPCRHEQRPRGSRAMIDAAGARARLREVRPRGVANQSIHGLEMGQVAKWPSGQVAKWPSGQVGMSAGFHPTR
jgi:hypothetical protein